ncbi:hypothetical protein NF701_02485 [Sphingomonadaceae bacterium OTU29THOMA1]|nr:hypothetical protein NF701_02485 [Sphingomonadaceae bacterium OTU29THOMA1]
MSVTMKVHALPFPRESSIESSTVLGRLRRLGRILVGDQRRADALINRSFGNVLPASFHFDETDGAFLSAVRASGWFFEDSLTFLSPPNGLRTGLKWRALSELATLSARERFAFALLEVEQFQADTVAATLQVEADLFRSMQPAPLEQLVQFDRSLLVHTTLPSNMGAIDSVLGNSGLHADHEVDLHRVPLVVRDSHYDLLLVDGSLSDSEWRSLMKVAAATGLSIMHFDAFFSSIRRDDIDDEEHMDFDQEGFDDAIRDALYVEPHRWTESDATFDRQASSDDEISDEALEPATAPIDAEVVNEQLRIAPAGAPDAVVPFSALDGVRRQHAEEARVLADEIRASNGSRRVERKLEALAEILERALTEDTVIALVVGIDGYARLLPTIQEEFMPLAAADMASFVYDIQGFTNQFPVARQFRAEAEAARPITADEEAALQSVVTVLLDQPDDIVAPAVKAQFVTLQSARAVQAGSLVSDVGWLRSVSNSLKAVARYAKTFVRDVHSDARGKAVKGMSALIVALPVAYGLQLLSVSYPVEFAALTVLLSRSREQIKSTFDGGDDKKDGEK